MSIKIHILSDLHVDHAPFTLPDVDADILILAGDTSEGIRGIKQAVEWAKTRVVVYVAGNHEYYRKIFPDFVNELRTIAESSQQTIYFLENDVLYFQGIRILGCTLWTDFKMNGESEYIKDLMIAKRGMNDYYEIVSKNGFPLHPFETAEKHKESREWLEKQLAIPFNGKTVIVTHHAPSQQSISPGFQGHSLNPAFISNMDYLFPYVDLWVHGHVHSSFDYTVGRCRVVCNPKGYPGEKSNYNSKLVVEV